MQAQSISALPSEELKKFFPKKIEGLKSGESKGKLISVGTLTYSMAEKSYSAKSKSIKFLLFDYVQAPIMYKQATQKWSSYTEVVSDTLLSHSFELENCIGWEAYHTSGTQSQIQLGIRNRYYLTIEAKFVDIELLRYLVREMTLEHFSN